MPACKLSENASETVREGFVELKVDQVWQIITADRETPFTTVLQDVGLPTLGSAVIFDTATLWCISRIPQRVDSDATGRKWNVSVSFSNFTQQFERDNQGNPVTDPTAAAKQVNIDYQEYSEPIEDAEFVNITKNGAYNDGTAQTPNPLWLIGVIGPVSVSSGEPRTVERTKYAEVITVSRVEADFKATYKTYTNAVNTDEVTITEQDSAGVKATYGPYPAYTLRMKPITSQKIWKDAIVYYRVTFVMEYNERTWYHSEADAAQKRRMAVDLYYPKEKETTYQQYVAKDLTDEGYQADGFTYATILTDQKKVAIGDPVPLNGWGGEIPLPSDAGVINEKDRFYVNWKVYKNEKAFGPLNL